MSMPAVTSWWWDMAGVLLPLRVHALDLRDLLYASHRRLRAEHNLGLLIPFGPGLCGLLRTPLPGTWVNKPRSCLRSLLIHRRLLRSHIKGIDVQMRRHSRRPRQGKQW